MHAPARLLIVDDDPLFTDPLAIFLARAGHAVTHSDEAGAVLAQGLAADLVLLGSPRERQPSLGLLAELRGRSTVPVIMIGHAAGLADRVKALEAGADDFVVKPLSPRELAARVNAVLRRVAPRPARPVLRFAGWSLDTETRLLTSSNGFAVPLPEEACYRLKRFLQNPGDPETREALMAHVGALGGADPFSGVDALAPAPSSRRFRGVGAYLAHCG